MYFDDIYVSILMKRLHPIKIVTMVTYGEKIKKIFFGCIARFCCSTVLFWEFPRYKSN